MAGSVLYEGVGIYSKCHLWIVGQVGGLLEDRLPGIRPCGLFFESGAMSMGMSREVLAATSGATFMLAYTGLTEVVGALTRLRVWHSLALSTLALVGHPPTVKFLFGEAFGRTISRPALGLRYLGHLAIGGLLGIG